MDNLIIDRFNKELAENEKEPLILENVKEIGAALPELVFDYFEELA